jgi:ketosteroid isomerase-like protein
MNDIFKTNIIWLFVISVFASLIANYIWAVYSKYGGRWKWGWQDVQNYLKNNIIGIIILGLMINLFSSYIFNKISQNDKDQQPNPPQLPSIPAPPTGTLPGEITPIPSPPGLDKQKNSIVIAEKGTSSHELLFMSPSTASEAQPHKSPVDSSSNANKLYDQKTKVEIDNFYKTYLSYFNNGDISSLLNLYSEKIVFLKKHFDHIGLRKEYEMFFLRWSKRKSQITAPIVIENTDNGDFKITATLRYNYESTQGKCSSGIENNVMILRDGQDGYHIESEDRMVLIRDKLPSCD